jgi:hypothetical protein
MISTIQQTKTWPETETICTKSKHIFYGEQHYKSIATLSKYDSYWYKIDLLCPTIPIRIKNDGSNEFYFFQQLSTRIDSIFISLLFY